jgi:2-oxoglutarate dehydrogenase E2 component (dihydrolipoamide succinyltransferase)
MRRQIAERMLQSVRTAPHVLTVMEADMSRVLAHQARNRPAFATQGLRLTLTAYIASALASSLRANPLVNSSWVEGGIQVHPHIHIGMAVSLGGEGLIVPVIRDADSLSLVGMARAVNDLAERARSGKLQAHEVRDGTFTLTNHGVGGSLFAMPIINQPQTGILGVGALHKRPIVISDQDGNDALAIRPMVYLSLVFDHRVLDGASADQFLAAVKAHLETPAF